MTDTTTETTAIERTSFETYFTWQGYLDHYKYSEQKEEEESLYENGKTGLLYVIANKGFLFIILTILVVFLARAMYFSRTFVHTALLFLFFDIFVDEYSVCIPLCQLLDSMCETVVSETGSLLKIKISLEIEVDEENNNEKEIPKIEKKEEKREPEQENGEKEEKGEEKEEDVPTEEVVEPM
jgi:hypothetical protein